MKLRSPVPNTTNSFTVPAAVVAGCLVLTACGGSSGGSTPGPVVDPNAPSFFNDDAKFSYADSLLGKFLGFFRSASSVSTGISGKRSIAALTQQSSDCTDGGSVDLSVTTNDVTQEPTAASIIFNNCREGSETSAGSLSITSDIDDVSESGTATITASNFSVTGGTEPIALNGTVTMAVQSNGSETTATINGPNMSMTSGNETIVFSNYSITLVGNEATDTASLSASLTLASNIDGTITIDISPPLTDDGISDYPSTGQLVMTHSDGSSLTMNADNGNPATFDYTINDRGAITTGVANWSDTELTSVDN